LNKHVDPITYLPTCQHFALIVAKCWWSGRRTVSYKATSFSNWLGYHEGCTSEWTW